MQNLYEVLGVAKDADQATIRKAFRKLARQYHPDVSKEPGAERRFKEINAAYQVLSDEEKRNLYDEFGEASLQSGFNSSQARAWKGASRNMPGGMPFPGFAGGGGMQDVDLEDLLSGLFSGRGRWGSERRSTAPRRGPDLQATTSVEFLTAVRGGEILLELRRPGPCGTCGGEGGTGRQVCPSCHGTGQILQNRFGLRSAVLCEECAGSGEVFAQECPVCAGSGRTQETRRIRVKVPAGVADGSTIRVRGQGGEAAPGGFPGDLLVMIEVAPHPFLRRSGQDLEMDLPITVGEATAGASVTVPTPAGDLKVRIPPGSASGTRMRLKNRGVPSIDGRPNGDLYLVLRPTVPSRPSEEAVRLAKEMDLCYDGDVRENLKL
jgi:molecular chaperone DnaJ